MTDNIRVLCSLTASADQLTFGNDVLICGNGRDMTTCQLAAERIRLQSGACVLSLKEADCWRVNRAYAKDTELVCGSRGMYVQQYDRCSLMDCGLCRAVPAGKWGL